MADKNAVPVHEPWSGNVEVHCTVLEDYEERIRQLSVCFDRAIELARDATRTYGFTRCSAVRGSGE